MIFYFSGLGNSRHIAESLVENDEQLLFIPDLKRAGNYEFAFGSGERVGFVFPVYAGRAPRLVSAFVRQMKITGRPGYTFMVCTYSNDYANTEQHFRRDLQRAGLPLDAAISVQMPNTHVNLSSLDVDSAELVNQKLQKAEQRLTEIKSLLSRQEHVSQMTANGIARLKSSIVQPFFYRFLVSDKPFHSTEACISCGLCAKSCPLQNILMVSGRPQWQGNCTTCLSCYHHCPRHAIRFGKATENKGQYVFGSNKSAQE